MSQRQSGWKLTILGLLLFLFAFSAAVVVTARPGDKVPPARPPQKDTDYVGGDTCLTCHDIEAAFKKNPHYKDWEDTAKSWTEKGCETCHGPGKEHVESGGDVTKIFNFKKAAAGKISDTCLDCHLQQEERVNFLAGEHGLNTVACTECHTVHAPRVTKALLAARTPALCYDCHGEVKPEFTKPFRHRVPEGVMSCTDCHNQHGGFNVRQTRESTGTDLICYTCHADKQGPFVYEHAPIKVEGCTICHTPHGSVNPRLLKRAEQHLLCLECHSNLPGGAPGTPSFHNVSLARYKSCTTCHVNIHGSNLHRFFFE